MEEKFISFALVAIPVLIKFAIVVLLLLFGFWLFRKFINSYWGD